MSMTFRGVLRRSSVRLALIRMLMAAVIGAGLCAGASADVVGFGPAPYASSAYGPVALGQVVRGAFTGPDDQDYLAFDVTRAGETLQFTVQNTTSSCADPYGAGCPVYLTLMDPTGLNQVGGPTSDAGTIATFGDTETFTWTFDAPGTYYMLMESDGDLPAGSPSYSVVVGVPASGGSPGGSSGTPSGLGHPSPPLVRSLVVVPRQRGGWVHGTVTLGQPAPLVQMRVSTPGSRSAATTRLRLLRAGRHQMSVRVPAVWRRRLFDSKQLRLVVRVSVTGWTGHTTTFTRRVMLRR
jgi:hypothetical protein